jgi:hypothetical protein
MSLPMNKSKLKCTVYIRNGNRRGPVLGKGIAELFEVQYRLGFTPWFGTADVTIEEEHVGSLAQPTPEALTFLANLNGQQIDMVFEDERTGPAAITFSYTHVAVIGVPDDLVQSCTVGFAGMANLRGPGKT